MRKILLSMALVLLGGVTMAQETTPETVEFTFTRNGADATVSVTGAEDVTATITATSPSPNCTTSTGIWNTGNPTSGPNMEAGTLATRTDVLCTSTNTKDATESAPITYTLTVTGLSGKKLSSVAFNNIAAQNTGAFQKNDATSRPRNLKLNINGTDKGLIENENIWPGTVQGPWEARAEKVVTFDEFDAFTTEDPLIITLSIYKTTDNNGVFYGLTKITLNFEAEEVVDPTPDPEEPIEYALYHPSGTNMTAAELMEVTEPTYIAIKGLSGVNNYYWNYVSDNSKTSTQYFKQDAVFVWEPVTAGVKGSYYLKKVGNGYMQASNPGTYVETTDGAGVFTAVKAVQVDSNASGSEQFNKDTSSTDYITNAGGEEYIVRLVTGENWLCLGNNATASQAPSIDKRYGALTIVQICKLQGFNETVDVQIKEAGNDDYATFYYNAPIQMPENVTAYTVAEITSNSAKLTEVAAGATIPANTGVILKTAVDGDSEIAITVAGDDVEPFTTNLLKGTVEATVATEDIYVLANHTSGVGLYKADRGNGDFTIKANGAYLLATDIPEANNSVGFRFDFATTAVEKVEMRNEKEEIYDLQGRRINEITQPGIYVVNGVKVLVK